MIHSSQGVETTHVSIDRGMEKQDVYIHTVEYCSALKREGILTHTTTQMNLEDIPLSKISGSQRKNTVCFHLYEFKFIET